MAQGSQGAVAAPRNPTEVSALAVDPSPYLRVRLAHVTEGKASGAAPAGGDGLLAEFQLAFLLFSLLVQAASYCTGR
jgi:hypothetical protein